MNQIDFLIVGAGPAGLAAAIHLKRKLNARKRTESVVVIDKASKPGQCSLSGAVFETACLDELAPGWREVKDSPLGFMRPVEQDDMYFLTPRQAIRIPSLVVPRLMHHQGDVTVSLSRLVAWLAKVALAEGVEIQSGFAVKSLLTEGSAIKGVRLVDLGLGRNGEQKPNFVEGETVLANVTFVADGSRGVLSQAWPGIVGGGSNPQVYSVGVKQLIKLPADHHFGRNRTIHTLGYPNRQDVFGGGFLYSMSDTTVAVGLILGLDWKYCDLNPVLELEYLKSHPFIAGLLEGGQPAAAGTKTIPEGGFYSLPRLFTDGAMILGDAAGFVNMEKIKGVHYAILSGMAASDAALEALESGGRYSADALSVYEKNLETRKVLSELRHARGFRQSFRWGVFVGAGLSKIQSFLPGRLKLDEDYRHIRSGAVLSRKPKGMDRATFVSLAQAVHREDEPSHVVILDPSLCPQCAEKFGAPCTVMCPGEVYRLKDGQIILSPSNCMHDGSCAVKCPMHNVRWNVPEGGEGPKFRNL